MEKQARKTSWGRRLVELGVVVGTVVVLAAIATPNFRAARERADQRAAAATLKTLAGAVEMYNLDNGTQAGRVDRKLLVTLRDQGYLQSIPSEATLRRVQTLAGSHGPSGAIDLSGPPIPDAVRNARPSWLGTTEEWPRRAGSVAAAPATAAPAAPSVEELRWQARLAKDFTATVEDALSTFAMDVDTGSYTRARQLLGTGRLPEPSTVRPEEFVNSFDYRDPPPARETFAVHSELAASPRGRSQALLRIGLRAREVAAEDRPPLHLTLVVDTSGSMRGPGRLGLVREALAMLVGELRADDRVGIVAYGSRSQVLLSSTPALRRGAILDVIGSLEAGGSTNFQVGLELGYREANRGEASGAVRRVVLCSDGLANQGVTDPEALARMVREQAGRRVYLSTFGFGLGDYQDSMMETLADQGDGAYGYVDDREEARRLFVDGLTGTMVPVARDAKIQVHFDPQVVRRYRLVGYENRAVADEDFRNDAVDAGEVGAGHAVTALYELELEEGAGESVGMVRIRYQEPDGERVVELQEPLAAAPAGGRYRPASPRLALASVAARFAEVLAGSPHARGDDLGELAEEARELTAQGLDDGQVEQLGSLLGRAAWLRERQSL